MQTAKARQIWFIYLLLCFINDMCAFSRSFLFVCILLCTQMHTCAGAHAGLSFAIKWALT